MNFDRGDELAGIPALADVVEDANYWAGPSTPPGRAVESAPACSPRPWTSCARAGSAR